jgi:hypothetical protein
VFHRNHKKLNVVTFQISGMSFLLEAPKHSERTIRTQKSITKHVYDLNSSRTGLAFFIPLFSFAKKMVEIKFLRTKRKLKKKIYVQ